MKLAVIDLNPVTENFRDHVLAGLSLRQKEISSKFLYDQRGSELFNQICELEEYYPTRTEVGLIKQNLGEITHLIGSRVVLIEYGAGNINKVRILLDKLQDPIAYVPIDISKEELMRSAEALKKSYSNLKVLPICADFTQLAVLPEFISIWGQETSERAKRNRVAFFPGSTIGNFEPCAAEAFLRSMLAHIGPQGGILIGADLLKDRVVLERAYDDFQGVTAQFNLNLLARINRELDGQFDLQKFAHRAYLNDEEGRIEMHLTSLYDQRVRVGNSIFHFKEGESIHTENSYKYTLRGFQQLASRAGLRPIRTWVDEEFPFSLHFLISE